MRIAELLRHAAAITYGEIDIALDPFPLEGQPPAGKHPFPVLET